MNNSTSSSPHNCTMSPLYWSSSESMFQATYYFLTPFYIIFGLMGHSICLTACVGKARQENAYFYQAFVAISELLQVLTGGLMYILTAFYGIIGSERHGPIEYLFQSNYFLVWYFACLASFLVNSFITSSLFLSVFMTCDRVYALAKPFSYRTSNHKKRQIVCFLISMFLGLGTSAFDIPRKTVHLTPMGLYRIGYSEYSKTILFTVFSQLRNAVRIFGLLALIGSNSVMIFLYRLRMKKVAHMVKDETKEIERKEGEKILLILTIYQSVSNTISMTCLLIYYFLFSFSPNFSTCGIFFMWPFMDFAVGCTYGFDFYFGLAISKQFRRFVLEQIGAMIKR